MLGGLAGIGKTSGTAGTGAPEEEEPRVGDETMEGPAEDKHQGEDHLQQEEALQGEQAAGVPAEVQSTPEAVGAALDPLPHTRFCFGCHSGFSGPEELWTHLRQSTACGGAAWQAAVDTILCLPGAGTKLWCPACPDDFIGKWSGPAAKACALLRHLEAAKANVPEHRRAHERLLHTLVELLLVQPPADDVGEEGLVAWAECSRMREAAGPLLARPGHEARRAVMKLQDKTLGPDLCCPALATATGERSRGGDGASDSSRVQPEADARELIDFSKLKMPKVTDPAADLYGDLAPTDAQGRAVIVLSDSDNEGPVFL